MQIRMKPEQLWRRLELARIKARSHYEREAIFSRVELREWRRERTEEKLEDAYMRLTLSRSDYMGHLMKRPWPLAAFLSGGGGSWRDLCKLREFDQICKTADDWVEVDQDELALVERWRKAPFAAHPSNAEAFPEIAPSPPDRRIAR